MIVLWIVAGLLLLGFLLVAVAFSAFPALLRALEKKD